MENRNAVSDMMICMRCLFDRLKKEIDRVHRTWEKKFAILQQR